MKLAKAVAIALVAIWILGANASILISELDRKHDCVEKEGYLKGLLWCETDATSSLALSIRVFKGLLWPIELLSTESRDDPQPENHKTSSNTLTEQEFNSSHLGMAYVCYTLAFRDHREKQAALYATAIDFARKAAKSNGEFIDHESYFGFAAIAAEKLYSKKETINFYKQNCAEPAKNIQKMIDDGMLK